MRKTALPLLPILSVAFAALPITTADAQDIAAPPGWSDTRQDGKRILSNDGVIVEVGSWQSTNGKSTRDWLKSQERITPRGVTYVATQNLQPERAIADSYALARSVKVDGRDELSVLYACPGKGGTVRLMELRAVLSRKTAPAIQRAAKFGEDVCRTDPQMASYRAASTRTASTNPARTQRSGSSASGTSQSLAAENAKIPAQSRPASARIILKQKWVGFPAVMINEATPEMSFSNGYATTCAKWNPLTQSPTPSSAGRMKRCEVKRGASKGKLAHKFSPGETISVSFGRISASSSNLGGSTSTISGGTLRMTKDGRIEIGKFNAFSARASGANAGGGNRKIAVSGRYYLNGHTITIKGDDGRVYHGFIAASSNKGGRGYDNIFINGEHYWDRKK